MKRKGEKSNENFKLHYYIDLRSYDISVTVTQGGMEIIMDRTVTNG